MTPAADAADQAPFVSVVVPAFNAEDTLDACLVSLLEQDYSPTRREILVVDNASTDGTPALLARYGGRIEPLHAAKRGPAAARNAGLARARGEIVAFTDADCVADAAWLRHLVRPLGDSAIGISGGRILAFDPGTAAELFGEQIHDHRAALSGHRLPYAITMNWASPRALLEKLAWFDEDLLRCEDVDLAYRVHAAGYRMAYVDEAVVYHRNERTLGGLFREGFAHGIHSVAVLRKHAELVERNGHRRFDPRTYANIAGDFRDYWSRRAEGSLCSGVFNAGKKVGKILGSIRFAHLEI